MANDANLANAIASIKAAFPNWNSDAGATMKIWKLTLSDLDAQTLDAAVMSLITEAGRAFAPSVGEIRGEALRLRTLAAGIPAAWQAYEEVINMPPAMERREVTDEHNAEGSVIVNVYTLKWSHPVVGEVARLMGWPERFPSDNPTADRAQFTRTYDAEVGRQTEDAGRLALVQSYVDQQRQLLGGITSVTRLLEKGGKHV